MNIYNYHPDIGVFLGISQADPDPLVEGNWLIPAFATTVAPPQFGISEHPVWKGTAWVLEPIPAEPEPEAPPAPYEPTQEELRLAAYRNESDPLFFKWQRGEKTQQAWLDKVNEIKARYP